MQPIYSRNTQLQTWLVAVARHDAIAFRELYDATSPKLFGFLLRILQKSEWAEEVLQESYVSIWNNAASYQPALAAPMTWMSTIARNKAFDALRRHDAAVEIDADGFAHDVMQALHREAIALAYYHDLSHIEVAKHMELPIGTVKS